MSAEGTDEGANRQPLNPTWTIRATLEWTQGHLESKGVDNPRLTAQRLVGAAAGCTRLELYTNFERPLSREQLATLRDGIKRRVAGEPLQYILGKAPFRRLELVARQHVLIPRPETEVLVDVVISALGDAGVLAGAHILDLGTGTGCIALSLLQECPEVKVVATDIDPQAVVLARENAEALGYCVAGIDGADDSADGAGNSADAADDSADRAGRLMILEDDLASSLIANPLMLRSFDAIVSNPPYIPTDELANLPIEIAEYESLGALDGGAEGLDVFCRIVEQAKLLLKPYGLLACELYETKLDDAREHCLREGLVDVLIHRDLADRPRIITAHTRS